MAQRPGAGAGGRTRQNVELSLHAQGLRNVAGAFKGTSDPFAVVTLLAASPNEKPKVLGTTETVKNCLDPTWIKTFTFDYELGKPTHINVGIYDETRKSSNDRHMGSSMFEIGEILGSRGNIKAKKLKSGGNLYAVVRQPSAVAGGDLELTLHGVKLANVEDGLFGKSDPFFELARKQEGPAGVTYSTVVRSKVVRSNLNPKWMPLEVSMDRLCDNDRTRPILISVYDYEKSGKHHFIGKVETTVSGLLAACQKRASAHGSKPLVLQGRRGKRTGSLVVADAVISGQGQQTAASSASTAARPSVVPVPVPVNAGAAVATGVAAAGGGHRNGSAATRPYVVPVPVPVNAGAAIAAAAAAPFVPPSSSYSAQPAAAQPLASQQKRPTFVEYISGGCELNMCVAIDFTGSNGDPRIPGTLHHIHRDGHSLNDYEKAITAVGAIVAKYDSDQKFPVWGFGAKYGGVIQHCFQVGPAAEASGVRGILESYRSVFQTPITMSGPTLFQDVIRVAADRATKEQEAAQRQGRQAYTVLLILTDGSVSDVNATKNALMAASQAPISVVIVGIGGADFSAMHFLDDFAAPPPARDIAQFVEFRRHQHDQRSLTVATLEEIPDQLVDYFMGRGQPPLPMVDPRQVGVNPDLHNSETDIEIPLNFNEDEEITLNEGSNGLYVGGTSFSTGSQFFGTAAMPPPVPVPPQHGVSSQPYQPSAPTAPPYSPHPQPPEPYNPTASFASTPSYQPAPAPKSDAKKFRVQVPNGMTAGMQLQVTNPFNGQLMRVVVPQGVAPGGVFDVQC